MLLKKLNDLSHSLSFRLTVWYGLVFTISTFVLFWIVYMVLSNVLGSRLDKDLINEFEELSSLKNIKGIEGVITQMNVDAESKGNDTIFFRIVTFEGEEIGRSTLSSWGDVIYDETAIIKLAKGIPHVLETVPLANNTHKARLFYKSFDSRHILQIGYSLIEDREFMAIVRRIFFFTGGVMILLGGLTGWFMGKHALRGIRDVTSTALKISEGGLGYRAYINAGSNEVIKLVEAFNRMLDHINALITGMREITDNIAHDLKTPITRIRGAAEMIAKAGETQGEQESPAFQIMDECDRLIGIVNTMLDISEAEAGAGKFHGEDVDMDDMVRDAWDLFVPLAEGKNIRLVTGLVENGFIKGDLKKLQRMVANLLDNAIKFTPSGGEIRISVERNENRLSISIRDNGIGIAPDETSFIFDRFYQCDKSRTSGGVGLGLSLARTIARAHGGDIIVQSAPGKGTTFTITLPL